MLNRLIAEGQISLGMKTLSKEEVISAASELLAKNPEAGQIGAEKIRDLLMNREGLGSTGIGDGIAIPHATDDRLEDFHFAVITIPDGVDFDSIDRKAVQVVFAMVGPSAKRSVHVRILAALSRLSKKKGCMKSLVSASTAQDVMALFLGAEEPEAPEPRMVEKSLFFALVQESAYLEPLLEVLASVTDVGITVLEGHGAGRYLHAMPLFSVFWTDNDRKEDIKLVLAVIDKHTGNDIIRRISSTVADPAKDTGLLVALQDLSLVSGSLEL